MKILVATTLCLLVAPSLGGPQDIADDVVEAVAAHWSRLAETTLADAPFRDKQRFASDIDETLAETGAPDATRRSIAEALARSLDDDAPAGRVWRTHELRARLLEPLDEEATLEALRAALAAYPEADYPAPRMHSYFQHLAGHTAARIFAVEGAGAAREFLLDAVRNDARYSWFFPGLIESEYLKRGDARGWKALRDEIANALEERGDGDQARALRAREIPDVRLLDGDPKKLFVVLGAEVPTDGLRDLVVVMPGGNGQALEFLPWLNQLTEPLLDQYAFVVLSSPQWNDEQARNYVWVTERYAKKADAKFTVEEFARDTAENLREEIGSLDDAYLFAWSSGGPAAYATILDRDDTFAGAYVLASVFKPDQLDTRRAKGRRFFLEQGRRDRVTPPRFAEAAADELEKRGGETELVLFDGGHGFAMPDAEESLRRALAWLGSEEE